MILRYKIDAEQKLVKQFEAIITVPAYLTRSKKGNKKRRQIAGFKVDRLKTTTAAALAYGLNKKKDQQILC
jgi:molecular chaperone DnaK (HSP70)